MSSFCGHSIGIMMHKLVLLIAAISICLILADKLTALLDLIVIQLTNGIIFVSLPLIFHFP